MDTQTPTQVYIQRIELLTVARKKLAAKKETISWSRLAALAGAGACFYMMRQENPALAIVIALTLVAVFLRLVVVALNIKQQLDNTDRLISINQQELAVAAGHYYDRPDGSGHLPPVHAYAYDLDIFGRASLFQFMNRTTSGQGSAELAQWLLQPANAATIAERQAAAKELAPNVAWRQQFGAHGMASPVSIASQQKIQQWLHGSDAYFAKSYWQIIRFLGPAIIICILLLYIFDIIPAGYFNLSLVVFFVLSGLISKKATPVYNTLNRISPEVAALSASIAAIEQQPFNSSWLSNIKQKFEQGHGKASVQVKLLNGILSRLDYRLNPVVFIPLNIFLFWDLQQMLAFEKWKRENKAHIMQWFDAVGEMEAMASIATLAFNHPEWVFHIIEKEHGTFAAEDLGHPLIPDNKRVNSSFGMAGLGKVAVITGSNMAGKSTFLRSIGLALVMGQMGAPVCARRAAFACMQVMSSMRISDNLEESTSTFYAELKKLKAIIDAVNNQEKVFLLLDEILRGTNSLDRHTGSKALIKQLIHHQAAGIIATHDLALAALVNDYPAAIHNYHFDVQVAGEELYFDYKLKTGICQSLNASVLMKKIGIEM